MPKTVLGIGGDEFLLIVIVALVAIGPKDLPRTMLIAGRWMGKARRLSAAFAAGLTSLANDSEIKDLESSWEERREAILKDLADNEASAALADPASNPADDSPASEPQAPPAV